MSETYEVLMALVLKMNRRGWHSTGCNVHPKEVPTVVGDLEYETRYEPGGACDCGADQLVDRVNKLLKEIEPGQMSLPGI
jgi:hypothetical protein